MRTRRPSFWLWRSTRFSWSTAPSAQPWYGQYGVHIQSPTGTRSALMPRLASSARCSSVTHFSQWMRSWRLASCAPSTRQKPCMSIAVSLAGRPSNW